MNINVHIKKNIALNPYGYRTRTRQRVWMQRVRVFSRILLTLFIICFSAVSWCRQLTDTQTACSQVLHHDASSVTLLKAAGDLLAIVS